jgi:pyridoxine 5-phosphate synthase
MIELGINIDHVATVRQARRTYEPDPVTAAAMAELGGADVITVHLREDRRHIQDRDVRILRETVSLRYNLELACSEEIVKIACEVKPDQATLVPEKREEVTTEGGLDIASDMDRVRRSMDKLRSAGISVSLFLDPDPRQLELAADLGADAVELHTGSYALARGSSQEQQLKRLQAGALQIVNQGMRLHAGHGLNYQNVRAIAAIPSMRELNIGHSIVARAIFVGLTTAVSEMKQLLLRTANERLP